MSCIERGTHRFHAPGTEERNFPDFPILFFLFFFFFFFQTRERSREFAPSINDTRDVVPARISYWKDDYVQQLFFSPARHRGTNSVLKWVKVGDDPLPLFASLSPSPR